MGCRFCATGRQGLQESLPAAEILNQIVSLPERDRLTNLVFMGMGEPLDNVDNVLQALVGALVLRAAWDPLLGAVVSGAAPFEVVSWVVTILSTYVSVNLVLCFFNLIPLPPLDGSKVVLYFLTGDARRAYYQIQQYAMPILVVALYIVPQLLHVDPIGRYLDATAGSLYGLLLGGR